LAIGLFQEILNGTLGCCGDGLEGGQGVLRFAAWEEAFLVDEDVIEFVDGGLGG